jgi:hypothetical protein
MLWLEVKRISTDTRDSLLFSSSLWPVEVRNMQQVHDNRIKPFTGASKTCGSEQKKNMVAVSLASRQIDF